MDNPPDKIAIAVFCMVSILLLGSGLFVLMTPGSGKYATMGIVGSALAIISGSVLLGAAIFSEMILRPRVVEVGDKIILKYPFNKNVIKEYDSISGLRVTIKPSSRKA